MICFNLDDKIKTNQTQYDLSTEAAKISALPLKSVDKYAHLTFEDLGYKPGVAEQAKFEYSPLGKVFNKRLEKEDKKKGLLTRLKNIEDKTEEQLKLIEDKQSKQWGLKSVVAVFDDHLSQEGKYILYTLSNQEENIEQKRLNFKRDKT